MTPPQPPVQSSLENNGILEMSWSAYFSTLTSYLGGMPFSKQALPNFTNDTTAAAGGVALYAYYRNGSIVMQRVV
jgi:hypothetical protein